MQARLKVVQDNANLKQVKLLPVTVIGRGAECHLKIASTQVSRKHCRITVGESDVVIEDLTSSNGTYVDQQRIPSGQPITLAPGATLQIGPATFIIDYSPPVNLETMPTTVIKASDLPPPISAIPPVMRVSETSIPIIDPFAEAVSQGAQDPGHMTPEPTPADSAPVDGDVLATKQAPTKDEAPPNIDAAAPSLDAVSAAEFFAPLDEPEVEIPASEPALQWPADDAPDVVPSAQAILETATYAPQPAAPAPASAEPAAPIPMSAVVVPAPPPLAFPVAKAIPVTAPFKPVVAATVRPATPIAPAAAPPVAASFDFLGNSAPAAVEPTGFDAFQFAVPAAPAAGTPTITPPSSAAAQAAKKSMFGLFGKKEKPAETPPNQPANSAPASVAPARSAPPLPPKPEAPAFEFFPVAAPDPAPTEAAAPADPSDPFAFLK